MPVVRVDDEVWKWLQRQARPFEDTPNSVLRRVAGLDIPISSSDATSQTIGKSGLTPNETKVLTHPNNAPNRAVKGTRVTGELLNRKYRLGARHALYHKDGTFYERLSRFPAVYCDTRGFVRFDSEQQFILDSILNVGEKVNIHRSLASHPRYQRFPDAK